MTKRQVKLVGGPLAGVVMDAPEILADAAKTHLEHMQIKGLVGGTLIYRSTGLKDTEGRELMWFDSGDPVPNRALD